MPNIAVVLKSEIVRLARREIKGETDALKRASSHYRSEIASLKREINSLKKQISELARDNVLATEKSGTDTPASAGLRFRADGLKKYRERLGLSAVSAGKLIGVSALTVYNWEAGKTKPRQAQLLKIANLRKLSKREAEAILEALQGS
jgi:DNA-binding transcriptional regulator YiaG